MLVYAFFQTKIINFIEMKEKTLFHQLTDLYSEALEKEIMKKES